MPPNRALSVTRPMSSGADGAFRNRYYLIWFPALLAVVGLIGLVVPTPPILVAELVIASLIACASLSGICSARFRIRISRVLGTGLLQGYALGSLPTAVSSLSTHASDSVLYGANVHTYALALCQVFLGVAILWLIGELTEPLLRLPKLSASGLGYLKRFAWIGTGLLALGVVTGRVSYMGASSEVSGGEGHTSVLVSMLSWVVGPTVGATATILALSKLREHRALYGGMLICQMISVLPTGRRNFLYALLLLVLLYSTWRPQFVRSIWKFSATILLSLLVIYVAWSGFLLLRLATYTYAEGEAVHLPDLVARAWVVYNMKDQGTLADRWSETDVEQRINVIDFDMDLLDKTLVYPPAYGAGAWNNLIWAVPSAFWPNKAVVGEEDYASELFHASYPDEANSIFTAATIDFGFWGGLFYPVLVSWMLSLLLQFCRLFLPGVPVYLCACAILMLCLETEVGLSGYLVAVRDTVFFGGIFVMVMQVVPAVLRQRQYPSLRSG